MENATPQGRTGRKWLYVLLVIPFIATLWVPFYQSATPDFYGIPYFYWYMFLWVILTSILTAVVYVLAG